MKVKFIGELGDDAGGLKREYFTLLAREISGSMCEGMAHCHVLRHNSVALQVNYMYALEHVCLLYYAVMLRRTSSTTLAC